MPRSGIQVADIFRQHGEAWRVANRGHVSAGQLRVMGAIEACRTAKLGGHVERCADCQHTRIAYNSCRNRHCPQCQWHAAQKWLEARQAELLPVPYFHVVFTLPAEIAALAYQNKAKLYGLLFAAAAEALTTIAADPRHLGAEIGLTAVLHSWGQAMDHHPHIHCIVPGGGLAAGDKCWVNCRPGFFLPVRVLSRIFRRLYLEGLARLHATRQLQFFGSRAELLDAVTFQNYLAPLQRKDWVVYAKEPFAGPAQVLAYLARYTHRVAIANSRLIAMDVGKVRFRWKDYRQNGKAKAMTLSADEFMRRFLMHTLPDGFHRIRHYGFLANGHRARKVALCRTLLDTAEVNCREPASNDKGVAEAAHHEPPPCPFCGGRMIVIEVLVRGEPCNVAPAIQRHHPRWLDAL
jgi:Putative transposase/Transposase zinc-binding domain